jgi:phosphate transport system ATP-binding protein
MVGKTLSTIQNSGFMSTAMLQKNNNVLQLSSPSIQCNSSLVSPPSVRTEQLSLSHGNKLIFKEVCLSIEPGSVTALIGPSGCGKTSFLSCLNRLTEMNPQSKVKGSIRLGGVDTKKINVIELRRRVGMLFQKPVPFPFSIQDNIEFPLREHGIKERDRITSILEEVLQNVGLWDEVKNRLHHSALSLSGGQQQRLCLARAIALNPDVLLMDEPCSALDPISCDVIEELISNLRGRYTILIVTHNLAQARRVADDAALLWNIDGVGHLIESGSVEQMFESPYHPLTKAYISGKRC